MAHRKVAWSCSFCQWLTISDSRTNTIDGCHCGQSSLELDEEYMRGVGLPYIVAVREDNDVWKPSQGNFRKQLKEEHIKFFNKSLDELTGILKESDVPEEEIHRLFSDAFDRVRES